MAHLRKTLYLLLNSIKLITFGTFMFIFIFAYCIISLPMYLYRWIISKLVAPCFFGPDVVKAVNVASNGFTLDWLEQKTPPRCGIIVNMVVEGTVTFEEFYKALENKWITAKDAQGKLKYPELQQYLESWMGVMFWKQDKEFDLKHHAKHHELPEIGSDSDSEQFLLSFNENLINQRFPLKRGPWDIHLIHNYKNSSLLAEKGLESQNLTLCVFHVHHCIIDGYAMLHLLLEELSGNPMEKSCIAMPTMTRNTGARNLLLSLVTFPVQVLLVLGKLVDWTIRRKSPFHIPDSKKNWEQIYARAPLIPTQKLKLVKSTFGVSFASVLNSACAAALGRIWKKMETGHTRRKIPENMLFSVAVPKPNHPKKLRIHVLGVAFDAPVSPEKDPVERLRECEKYGLEVRDSPMALLANFAIKIFSAQPASIASLFLNNVCIPTGMTSFPGPGIQVRWNGGPKVLAMDFAAGVLPGVAGLGLMAITYDGNMQICATAESALFDRDGLDNLLHYICEEIQILYERAVASSENENRLDIVIERK